MQTKSGAERKLAVSCVLQDTDSLASKVPYGVSYGALPDFVRKADSRYSVPAKWLIPVRLLVAHFDESLFTREQLDRTRLMSDEDASLVFEHTCEYNPSQWDSTATTRSEQHAGSESTEVEQQAMLTQVSANDEILGSGTRSRPQSTTRRLELEFEKGKSVCDSACAVTLLVFSS